MASYNKFNQFVQDLARGVHNFSTHQLKIMLTNVPPLAANKVKADITEITAGHGYSAGGSLLTITDVINNGIEMILAANLVFTASGGTIGPCRYAVLYNSTPTSPLSPLIAWWDYGSSVTINDTETLTIGFDATNGIMQIS